MLANVSELNIPEDDPFKNDKLERIKTAENLTNFLKNISTPFVLAINSPWGTGKTTFIKMWKEKLRMQGNYTLLYNAWKNDFTEDPFISFMGEIDEEIETSTFNITDPDIAARIKNSWKETRKVGITIGKRLLPAVISLATAGILRPSEEHFDSISRVIRGVSDDFFEEYRATKKSMEKFKDRLAEFVSSLSSAQQAQRPLLIFIDELDRCRPLFSSW